MAFAVGYQELSATILALANVKKNTRYTDTFGKVDVMRLVNRSITRLDDEVGKEVPDFHVASQDIALLTGQTVKALPALFKELRRLYYTVSGSTEVRPVKPFMLEEQTMLEGAYASIGTWSDIRYRIFGQNIRFLPTPTQNYDLTLDYVRTSPLYTDPTADEQLEFVNGWNRYVELRVASQIIEIEGRDGSVFAGEAQVELRGIIESARSRNRADADYMVYYPNDVVYNRRRV